MSAMQRFLVVHDYGSGGVWFFLDARDEEQIRRRFRTVTIYAPAGSRPDWMSDAEFRKIEAQHAYGIDDLPKLDWINRLLRERPVSEGGDYR